jgi:hypothetical protein
MAEFPGMAKFEHVLQSEEGQKAMQIVVKFTFITPNQRLVRRH